MGNASPSVTFHPIFGFTAKSSNTRGYPTMKHYLVLALATIAFFIAAPSAFATRVIFDPPDGNPPPPLGTGTDCTLSSGGLNDFTPCNVSQTNVQYFVTFVDCKTLAIKDPDTNQAYPGWCLYMVNNSNKQFDRFAFEFTAPEGGSFDGTDMLECGSQPVGKFSNNCEDGTHITAGDLLDMSFFGPVAARESFFLITDFKNSPGYAGVTVAVPEPATLGLFGLGLLALGAGLGWQRRQSNAAA